MLYLCTMKDLKTNIEKTQNLVGSLEIRVTDVIQYSDRILLKNQIAIMEALQDIQEKMTRIEGKMRGFK
jgi:hypothetical protein